MTDTATLITQLRVLAQLTRAGEHGLPRALGWDPGAATMEGR